MAALTETHLRKYRASTVQNILPNTYVDNIIITTLDGKKILKNYTTLKNRFQQAKMNIRQFIINHKPSQQSIPGQDRDDSDEVTIIRYKLWTDVPTTN